MYSHYIDDFLKTLEDTRKELSLENLTNSLKEFNNKKKRFSDDFIKNIQHSAELISLFYLQKAILQHEKNPLFFDACYDVWAESVLLLQKNKTIFEIQNIHRSLVVV